MDRHRDVEIDEGATESLPGEASDDNHDASTDDESYARVTSENELSNGVDLCGSCKCIPWTDILQSFGVGAPDLSIIRVETMWKASWCPVCRVFARIVETQKLPEDEYYGLTRYQYHPHLEIREVPGLPALDPSQKACILYLALEDHPVRPHLVVTNLQPKDKSSEQRYNQAQNIDVDQVKSWIRDCDTSHGLDCVRDTAAHLALQQLRVIDCDKNIVVSAPERCRYVALSYVWGQHGGAFEKLQDPPKTIANSIYLTRELGYRYLWIDRYCIDQVDHIDKHMQVNQMGDIYASAQVTLVAAVGSDPTYGLPGVPPNSRLIPEFEMIRNVWLQPIPRLVKLAEVAESKWAFRAWTFQEFHRSRRRLIFTENQAIFVCNSGIEYEMTLSGFSWTKKFDKRKEEDSHWARHWLPQYTVIKDKMHMWTKTDQAAGYLQDYSNRHLTYDTDALNAIVGALDPLRKDSVYHIWGALFRYTVEHPSGFNSSRPRDCTYGMCSGCRSWEPGMTTSRQSTTQDDSHLESIPSDVVQDPQGINEPSVNQKADQQAILGYPKQIEMALTWYHNKRARRRPGFPSWSSLGWEGPLSWYRAFPYTDESCVVLSHACKARLHFPKLSYNMSKFDPALQESLDSTPPTLEATIRTAELELVLDGNQSQVALEMNANYKYMFRLDWDVDPVSLKGEQIVGALLHSRSGEKVETFVLVLAARGGVLERVGLVHLPKKRIFLRVDSMRQQDLMPLTSNAEREAAETFLKSYSSDYGAWWQNIFGDYRPILIG